MTRRRSDAKIAAMFRRKNKEEASAPAETPETPAPSAPTTSRGGFVVTELPTYHAGKRKIVVYTSDASGRIVKSFKKG